ncbi:MAG: sialidase family protein [Thermoanaerobaculia bacterium]
MNVPAPRLRHAIVLAALVTFAAGALAATTPRSGTLSPEQPLLTYTAGPFPASNPSATTSDNPPACVPFTDTVCSEFEVTVAIPETDFNSYKARVTVSWTNGSTPTYLGAETADFDVWVYRPDVAGSQSAVAASTNNPEVATFNVINGLYTIYVLPYDVAPDTTFTATVNLFREPGPSTEQPTPNPDFPAGTPRFYNYPAPPGWAEDAGEPSIGANWQSEREVAPGTGIYNGGTITMFGGFLPYMLTATFDDRWNPAKADWKRHDLVMANLPRAFGDPILFTDPVTGRTFVSQEMGLTPLGSTMEFTDTDSAPFTPSEGSGAPSGIDHQTVGGGPYADPIPSSVDPNYPHGVWYCSQSIADAVCSISLDGGLTFGPAVPMYTLAQCSGLHGHIKIGPDGTAYVPNRACGTRQAVVVSEDNGITWAVRPIPDSTAADRDPSVAVARDGTIYFGYQDGSGVSKAAVSTDKGVTWSSSVDVGASMNVKNSLFHAAVAGDGERAAIAYFGTETAGSDYNTPDFPGIWYLYISTTFDRGLTWVTQNATPGDPIQRGGICGGGACRNLLDFYDATIDKRGRVLVGYDDGCISDNCIAGVRSYGLKAPNDFTAKAVIARQASGLRMFSEYDHEAGEDVDPQPPPPPPPAANACNEDVASDPSGDAQHPLIDNSGVDTSQVDLTGLRFDVSDDGTSLVTTIRVADFRPEPITGSLGTFYYAVWTAAQLNDDGSIASRTYATRANLSATGTIAYSFGRYDSAEDTFVGSTTTVSGTFTAGPNGTIQVFVPLSLLPAVDIPVRDLTTLPAVIEPYAIAIIHEVAVRFVMPADRAPNAGNFGANWSVCPEPTVVCFGDDDASIAYSAGWHSVNAPGASDGRFATHFGSASSHSATFEFEVASGTTGNLTYHFATSTSGGSAEVFVDGVSHGLVSFAGAAGSRRDPVFGSSLSFDGLAAGRHTFELRDMSGVVYIDGFCLESGFTTSSAATGPGTTTSTTETVPAAGQAVSQVVVPANATAISIAAGAPGSLPVRVVLVDAAGLSLATADSIEGVATLDQPVEGGGVYLVKTINLSVAGVEIWTMSTPHLTR